MAALSQVQKLLETLEARREKLEELLDNDPSEPREAKLTSELEVTLNLLEPLQEYLDEMEP